MDKSRTNRLVLLPASMRIRQVAKTAQRDKFQSGKAVK